MRAIYTLLIILVTGCSAPPETSFLELQPIDRSVDEWIDSDWVSNVEVLYGVRNGSYFYRLRNTSNDICHGIMTFENDDIKLVVLEPEITSDIAVIEQSNEILDIAMTCGN